MCFGKFLKPKNKTYASKLINDIPYTMKTEKQIFYDNCDLTCNDNKFIIYILIYTLY